MSRDRILIAPSADYVCEGIGSLSGAAWLPQQVFKVVVFHVLSNECTVVDVGHNCRPP